MKTRFHVLFLLLVCCLLPFNSTFAGPQADPESPAVTNYQIELVSQYKAGHMYEVTMQGSYAYAIMGSKFCVFDISDQESIELLSEVDGIDYVPTDMEVYGNYVYVPVGFEGMYIVDVSDKMDPEIVHLLPPTTSDDNWYAHEVSIHDAGGTLYAYIAAGTEGVETVNVTIPTSPVRTNGYKMTSPTGAKAIDVDVEGGFLYVAYFNRGLEILDLSIPSAPAFEGTYQHATTTFNFYLVDADGDYVYAIHHYNIGGVKHRMQVIDASDKANPVHLSYSNFYVTSDIYGLEKSGIYAYFLYDDRIARFDIAVPSMPISAGSVILGVYGNSLDSSGADVLASSGVTMYLVDSPTPRSNPMSLTGAWGGVAEIKQVVVEGDRLFTPNGGRGLVVVDISDPADPQFMSYEGVESSYHTGPQALDVHSDYAYLGSSYGFLILDVSDPLNMQLKGDRGGAMKDLECRGNYLHAGTYGNFSIADVSDPDSPAWIGNIGANVWSSSIDLVGDLAYMAEATSGVGIYDISDPSAISPEGRYNPTPPPPLTQLHFSEVEVSGDVLYATESYDHKIHFVDVSDPTSPVQIDTLAGFLQVRDMELAVNYWRGEGSRFAFVADYPVDTDSTITLLDVTDPTSVVELAETEEFLDIRDMEIAGNYIYAAGRADGLLVFRILVDETTSTIPTGGGTLISADGDTTITFPAGSFPSNADVTFKHLWQDEDTGRRQGIGQTFELDAVDAVTGDPVDLQPGKSFDVQISYDKHGAAIEHSLELFGWSAVVGGWVRDGISSSVNTSTNTVTATVDHMSKFAILGDSNFNHLPVLMYQY
jgi:hypothetical protein